MNYNYLKSYIVRSGLTNERFAEKLGITRQELSKKLNNKAYFSQPQMNKAKEILNLNAEEFSLAFSSIEKVEK